MDKENPNELKIVNKNERIKWLNIVDEKNKKIAALEEKITEKEKEIEELRFRERNINGLIEQLPNQNQKAIEELEKLLDKIQTLDVMVQSGHYINQKKVNVVFKDVIDQQIAELKGGK